MQLVRDRMRFKHFMLDCFDENVNIPLSNWPPVGRCLTGVFERPTIVAKKFMTRATEWLMDPNGDACEAWPRLVTSLCPPSPHRDHRHHHLHQSHCQYHHHHRSSIIIFNIMVSLATSLCVSQRPRQPRTGSSKQNGSLEKISNF